MERIINVSEKFTFINNEIIGKRAFVLLVVGKHQKCNE